MSAATPYDLVEIRLVQPGDDDELPGVTVYGYRGRAITLRGGARIAKRALAYAEAYASVHPGHMQRVELYFERRGYVFGVCELRAFVRLLRWATLHDVAAWLQAGAPAGMGDRI